MTTARPKTDPSTKRTIWTFIVVVALIVSGIYAYTELPPRQEARQELTTTVVTGDYVEPLTIVGGELVSVRPAGWTGELETYVEYTVTKGQENFEQFGPVLRARVVHDTGAVMVCSMGRSYLFSTDHPYTYTLGCDRTVDVDKVGEWSVSELTPLRHRPVNYG